MASFEITLPDGRTLDVDAPNAQAAAAGAAQWAQANAPTAAEKPARGFMDGVKQFGQEVASAAPSAVRKLASDVKEAATTPPRPVRSALDVVRNEADSWKRFGGVLADAVNVPLSVPNAIMKGAVSRPYGEAVSALTG